MDMPSKIWGNSSAVFGWFWRSLWPPPFMEPKKLQNEYFYIKNFERKNPKMIFKNLRCWWSYDIFGTWSHCRVLGMINWGWFSFSVSKMPNLQMSELEYTMIRWLLMGLRVSDTPFAFIHLASTSKLSLMFPSWFLKNVRVFARICAP